MSEKAQTTHKRSFLVTYEVTVEAIDAQDAQKRAQRVVRDFFKNRTRPLRVTCFIDEQWPVRSGKDKE